jgi:hypothetical protein
LGAAVTWLVLSGPAGASPTPQAAAPVGLRGGMAELVAEVRELRMMLANQMPTGDTSQASTPGSTPVPLAADPTRDLVIALRELTAALPGIPTRGDETVLVRPEALAAPTNQDAVAEIRSTLDKGESVIRPELFGLSPSDVYRRFGAPSAVETSDNGSYAWFYENPDALRDRFQVSFSQGHATTIRRQR